MEAAASTRHLEHHVRCLVRQYWRGVGRADSITDFDVIPEQRLRSTRLCAFPCFCDDRPVRIGIDMRLALPPVGALPRMSAIRVALGRIDAATQAFFEDIRAFGDQLSTQVVCPAGSTQRESATAAAGDGVMSCTCCSVYTVIQLRDPAVPTGELCGSKLGLLAASISCASDL